MSTKLRTTPVVQESVAPKPHVTLKSNSAIVPRTQVATSDQAEVWFDRQALIKGTLAAVAAFIAIEFLFIAFTHRDLEGDSHRAFLTGVQFGIPAREAAAGYRAALRGGADGQFYYSISNDLFGRYDAAEHIDNVVYRYQRIGIPALAGGLATLLGYELTPPLLMHSLNIAITCIGFGAMVYWLSIKQIHPAFALCWLLSVGTQTSITRGFLDSPADGLFIVTMLALLARRMWAYVPLAVLLLLTREMYSFFAFGIFAFTALNRFPWKDAPSYWKRVVLTALPGIVMLSWTAYIALHFHISPLAARRVPGMKSYPFYAMYKALTRFFREGQWDQLWPALAVAAMLVLVFAIMVRRVRQLPLALVCSIPYVLLSASLGPDMWIEYNGSGRIMNAMIVLGLFLMPFEKSIVLPLVLTLQSVMGVTVIGETRFANSLLMSPELTHVIDGYPPNPPDAPVNQLLNDPKCRIEWVDAQSVCKRKYDGIWNWAHRELLPVKIAITNESSLTWYPGQSPHAIWLSYLLYDAGYKTPRYLGRRAVILDQEIPPGETREVETYLELRQPGRKYVVEFSPWQEGPGTFSHINPSYGSRYEFTVE